MKSVASIYIPRMSTEWTEDGIKGVMKKNCIGVVSRVDFTPINKKFGFGEDVYSDVMSAFVHFEDPYHCVDGNYYWSSLQWSVEFWTNISDGTPYKLHVDEKEYWFCLKNKNPVKRTRMNVHQVVENCRYLETLVTAQAKEIETLKDGIEKCSYLETLVTAQAKEIETLKHGEEVVKHVIYNLLGGLFCQRTQGRVLNSQCNNLEIFPEGYLDWSEIDDDVHPSGCWPTTRQGDENSRKIEKLEEQLEQLKRMAN